MRKALLLLVVGVAAAGCGRREPPGPDRSSIMDRPGEVEADRFDALLPEGPEAETAALGPPARAARPDGPRLGPSSPSDTEGARASPSKDAPVGAGPPLAPEQFAPMLAEVQSRERATDFAGALVVARRMRAGFDGRPEAQRAAALVARLEEARSVSRDLAFAVKTLDCDDPARREYAAAMLTRAGPTGVLFLHRALEHESTPLAQRAAVLLLESGDEEAKDAIAGLLPREPGTAPGQELLAAWVRVYGHLPDAALVAVYRTVAGDGDHAHRDLLRYLAEAYRNHCESDAEQFAALVGDPEACGVLRGYVGSEKGDMTDSCRIGKR